MHEDETKPLVDTLPLPKQGRLWAYSIVGYRLQKQPEPTTMPYCATTFQTITPERVENVLSSLTKAGFIGGPAKVIDI
jgi:hypothetical protein